MPGGFVPYHHDGPKKGQPYKDPGYTSGGSKSGGTGGGSATYGSPSSPTTSAAAGVQSVASTAATGAKNIAKTGSPAAPAYSATHPTTTIDLRPQISSITDPATRALASSAISSGLKYEVNPSVLLAAASVTDYGRKGQGKGYTNLGDGSEDGAKSIRQAAKYLSEAGFHSDPDGAIKALAKTIGHDPSEIRKTASGYTELDKAARTIEETPGDMRVKGVGRFKYRKPEDRPSSKVARAARDAAAGVATAGVAADRTTGGWGTDDAIAVANGRKPLAADELQAAQGAAALGRTAVAAQGILPGSSQQQQQQGPNPRRVATKLTRAADKALGSVPDYVPQQYRGLISDASKKTGVPAGLLSALLQQESGFDPNISSPAGASGIAQFMPGTAASRGVDALDPKSAIPGAAELLAESKAQFGSWEKALAAYNAGPGAVDEALGLDGGSGFPETLNYVKTIMGAAGNTEAVAKQVPKQLVQRATDVLGREATKALLAGGRLVKAPKGGVKEVKFDGRYAGSQDMVRAIVGTRVKGDHGGTKNGEAPGVHTANGDHYRADGYAQDINGTSPGENEPPYNQQTLDTMVANLRKMGADVPDLTIGENWEGTVGKYSVQLLTNEGGTVNHIHIGAHPTDGDGGGSAPAPLIPIKGTNLAVRPPAPASSGSGGSTSYGGTSGTGSPADALGTALNEAAKQQQGGGSLAPGLSIQSAAAAYARKSLQGGDTQDPLYDAFRPSR